MGGVLVGDTEDIALDSYISSLPKQSPGARCLFFSTLKRRGARDKNFLDKYREIASEYLPRMREGGLLYRIINKEKPNVNIVLVVGDRVLGGATICAVRNEDQLIVDVVAIVVDQRVSTCGKGHGTRIVNAIKQLARAAFVNLSESAGIKSAYLLTQSDGGQQASSFWKKQGFEENLLATSLVEILHRSNPRRHKLYDGALAMCCSVTNSAQLVRPAKSSRAQEYASLVEDVVNIDCLCRKKDVEVDQRLVSCDTCKKWQHWRCYGFENESDIPESFSCKKCTKKATMEAAERVRLERVARQKQRQRSAIRTRQQAKGREVDGDGAANPGSINTVISAESALAVRPLKRKRGRPARSNKCQKICTVYDETAVSPPHFDDVSLGSVAVVLKRADSELSLSSCESPVEISGDVLQTIPSMPDEKLLRTPSESPCKEATSTQLYTVDEQQLGSNSGHEFEEAMKAEHEQETLGNIFNSLSSPPASLKNAFTSLWSPDRGVERAVILDESEARVLELESPVEISISEKKLCGLEPTESLQATVPTSEVCIENRGNHLSLTLLPAES